MIGVIADPADHEVVREFFELFKTPWEFGRSGQRYDVLLYAGDGQLEADAALVVRYAGRKTKFDDAPTARRDPRMLAYRGQRIPIYGQSVTFDRAERVLLTEESSGEPVAYLKQSGADTEARIGYDLFSEVRYLITTGQPIANAGIPSLELHIAFLRELIIDCGISLAEIPPVPEGFKFIACLTHDVDHPSIRKHRWEHTSLGFLSRALFGSAINLVRGRMSLKDAITNWLAVVKLPFVYFGFARDPWAQFADRYVEVEKGLPSSFFFIPFKNRPGKTVDGTAHRFRAVPYEARELKDTINKLTAAGCEIGLHGIDAWCDRTAGQQELDEIRNLAGNNEIGVRMHWLFFNESAPFVLDKAGATYDSTVGYNETVGFRAGTTQAYKPLGVDRLLELPMHVMDTALFYPIHLALSPEEAQTRISRLADVTTEFGGCLTVNWHDRSLGPERLWGKCYHELIEDLKKRGAWFGTAAQVTAWFRKRRAAIFEMKQGKVPVSLSSSGQDGLPGLRLRVHGVQSEGPADGRNKGTYVDVAVHEPREAVVPLGARR
jgi:hypothetical protein